VTRAHNTALSNAAWKAKQQELNLHSKLLLNGRLIHDYPDTFDEAAIDARSAFLAQRMTEIWPGPDAWDVPSQLSDERQLA
jgi:hypothetical protein